jgi:hypothetical protein
MNDACAGSSPGARRGNDVGVDSVGRHEESGRVAGSKEHAMKRRQLILIVAVGIVSGWSIWQLLEQYIRGVYRASGYQEVR